MAEANPAEIAMAESSNLSSKARDIIVSPSHEGLAILVKQLFMRQESNEYQTARALFDFCVSDFSNCLPLQLLKVYRCSSNGVLRFQSIYLLSETLADFRNRSFKLSLDALYEIKPVLISCLTMQETKESDMKILTRIVSFVAYNVVVLYNGKWDELSDCILLLANKEPSKAFHVFIYLPPVYKEFIDRILLMILQESGKVFLSTEQREVQDWSLALKTVVTMEIQLVNIEKEVDVIKKLMGTQLSCTVDSVNELVKKGKEQFLVQGLEDFERFLSRDVNLYNHTEDRNSFFVSELMKMIEGAGTQTKEIVRKINMLAIKPQDVVENHRAEFHRWWYDHLNTLSSLEVLKIYASTDLEDRSREIAIRWLNALLSDHTLKTVQIGISEMRQLQPLLISCLKEGVSDSMFKVLGEVVNHVAYEMFVYQDETWCDLRDYIVWQSKTEFQRAVYIFQCLTMTLVDDEFVNPVMESLLPGISTRLNPPTELLVDNSCWVLAFTGAFCTTIQLIDSQSVKKIAHKMIDSVRELVERGMEVGLVRRAFRDVETIVKKQLEWYATSEYKFVKGLLWKLYAIKGMKWESKIVLWRINVILEREVDKDIKELPENDFDWLQEYENEEEEEEEEEKEEKEDEEREEEEKEEEEKGEEEKGEEEKEEKEKEKEEKEEKEKEKEEKEEEEKEEKEEEEKEEKEKEKEEKEEEEKGEEGV